MGTRHAKKQQAQQNIQAESYYKNLTTGEQINGDSSPKEQIQMFISLRGAELNVNYTISLYFSFDGNPKNSKCVSRTETQQADDNGNLNFDLGFILDYYFERQQFLIFTVNKNSNNYDIDTTLGNIMGSRGQTLIKGVTGNEKIVISATTLKNNNINVAFTLNAYYKVANVGVFYTVKKMKNNIVHRVYKSEVKFDPNGNFQFNKIKIPASVLCNGEFDSPILIEFHDYNFQKSLGTYETTVDKLASTDRTFTLTASGIQVNCLCEFIKEFTFIDYLRGGLQLALSIGIDFTGSNGNPNDIISLHYTGSNSPNLYERAIRSCGDIVAYYDYDQLFPVYGYGAVLPGTNQVSKCFPLNLSNDPNINMIDEVLATYRSTVKKITFSGPTFFSPLINTIIQNIKSSENKSVYHILLILTDGLINDMDNTIDALVEASLLPLSVIIVGVGRNDFGNMNILDADENPLIDGKGRRSARDLVQFVPFYQFENDPKKLAEQVLEEIPRQVVEYFKLIGVPPGDPVVNII